MVKSLPIPPALGFFPLPECVRVYPVWAPGVSFGTLAGLCLRLSCVFPSNANACSLVPGVCSRGLPGPLGQGEASVASLGARRPEDARGLPPRANSARTRRGEMRRTSAMPSE